MVNVKKRKGRVVIDSDSEDSASDDNLDQVKKKKELFLLMRKDQKVVCGFLGFAWVTLARTSIMLVVTALFFFFKPTCNAFSVLRRARTSQCKLLGDWMDVVLEV